MFSAIAENHPEEWDTLTSGYFWGKIKFNADVLAVSLIFWIDRDGNEANMIKC